MNPRYPAVADRANFRCEYCRAPEIVFNFPFEVEHIVPQARGGSEVAENFALSCRACNVFKSDFETGRDTQTQADMVLFHPRRDIWERHFVMDLESGEIVGLTPTGRATASRLQMNRPHQIAARRRWMALGLFP